MADHENTPHPPVIAETGQRSVKDETRENAWIRLMTKVHWYPQDMPSKEKKLVLKLDLMILVYGCLCFFTKYLDQASLTNAYVTGMREELGMFGNELNYAVITFWSSYCVFMIPACYYLTRYPVNVVLPLCEIGWGTATFGLAWAQNVDTREIARRVALFYMAAPSHHVRRLPQDGGVPRPHRRRPASRAGAGLFIVDAIIHNSPSRFSASSSSRTCRTGRGPRCLSPDEHAFGRARLAGQTAPSQLKVSRDIFARVFRRWHWYLFVALWSIGNQNNQIPGSPFSLYLRANNDLYSVTRINTLPTVATAVSIVTAFTTCAVADRIGRFWPLLLAVSVPTVVAHALLVTWHIGEAGRVAAFTIGGFEGALFPLTMAWATVAMAGDAEERAVVTASMNAIGQAIVAWSQLLQFPAVEAPRFKKGFLANLFRPLPLREGDRTVSADAVSVAGVDGAPPRFYPAVISGSVVCMSSLLVLVPVSPRVAFARGHLRFGVGLPLLARSSLSAPSPPKWGRECMMGVPCDGS
ncbi:conserved hypothetical protein [Verticillium alfalfae VaMs.102]|uniref:Pantothenate transporter liz1 n=1 Tax=Verticillium alfalfae (strain VaMs.102 / ATCC MYA-4576 / FGSC 10136) TaxID=526221 RepID=C9SEC2_VERA1|nr:conserved hypothetical protein [Verticillium alfalfae VaMs.102]EEY16515.1 conserved hypothetical protein [Verticillium alfalfae VaMs.102]